MSILKAIQDNQFILGFVCGSLFSLVVIFISHAIIKKQ